MLRGIISIVAPAYGLLEQLVSDNSSPIYLRRVCSVE